MNTLPVIGRGRGIFEIFVPGVFLLLNIIGALCVLPLDLEIFSSETIKKNNWVSPALVWTAVTISFGYLLGVILRVLRSNFADHMSGTFLKLYRWLRRRRGVQPSINLDDPFPYINDLSNRAHNALPKQAEKFFDEVWSKVVGGRQGQAFFNFCKIMVSSEDEWLASEIYSAEALTRYMTSICYALTISFVIWAAVVVVHLSKTGNILGLILLIIVTYALAIGVILRNLRFVRLKEVGIVFDATFKCRDILFASKSRNAIQNKG